MSTSQTPFTLIHQPGPTGIPLHLHNLDELEIQARADDNVLALAVLAAADELREYAPLIRAVATYGDPGDLATSYETAIEHADRLGVTRDTAVQGLIHARDRLEDLVNGQAGELPPQLRDELAAVIEGITADVKAVEDAAGDV